MSLPFFRVNGKRYGTVRIEATKTEAQEGAKRLRKRGEKGVRIFHEKGYYFVAVLDA